MSAPLDPGSTEPDREDVAVSRRRMLAAGSAVAMTAWVAPQIVSTTAASAATLPPGPPPTAVAVGVGGEVFVSPDDGATWSAASVPPPGAGDLLAVAAAGSDAVAVGAGGVRVHVRRRR